MTAVNTWDEAWQRLNADDSLTERPNQRELANAVFNITQHGGVLIGEAPVGCGKSFSYCTALASRVQAGERCVISTETTALQDQLVDKDVPKIERLFGPFKFCSLKGRSHYLCKYRASNDNWIVKAVEHKNIGTGERRDVEAALNQRLSEDEWEQINGEADWCAQNRCQPDGCYSTRARELAGGADLVVTNHALLRTHADLDDGLLGDIKHLVVDEAHTLERVLIDGWSEELRPYDLTKSMEGVWDALDATNLKHSLAGKADEGERLLRSGIDSIVKLFNKLMLRRDPAADDSTWRRESFALSEQYLSGAVDDSTRLALEDYELLGPGRFRAAADIFAAIQKDIEAEMKTMDRVTRKVSKGRNGARRIAKVMDMIAESLTTRDGIVMRYGVPYVVLGEGRKAWKGDADVSIRCVPLDVSARASETIWKDLKSATLVSGTLRDETDGSFRYVQKSLGLGDAQTLVVGSGFDFKSNQLVYVTPATREVIDVPGARYSVEELVDVLDMSRGRALVLFTANAEMEYAAEYLRTLQHHGQFPHRLLVQERGASKPDLVRAFVEDTSSVLLGSKSFFTGVDFPGDTCSIVVLAKFPLPQFNSLCRAQIAHWRTRGFPNWYEREALQVFKQANGRLIRSETDRGVIAILDQRVADAKERVCELTRMEIVATGSAITNQLDEMGGFLHGAEQSLA